LSKDNGRKGRNAFAPNVDLTGAQEDIMSKPKGAYQRRVERFVKPVLPLNIQGHKLFMMQRWANIIGGHYGYPVFLVGSALTKEDPRDYDIRLRLPDKIFSLRYQVEDGDIEQYIMRTKAGLWLDSHWRYARDAVKQWERGCKFTRLNLDFQIYPGTYWKEFDGEPRLRLDKRAKV